MRPSSNFHRLVGTATVLLCSSHGERTAITVGTSTATVYLSTEPNFTALQGFPVVLGQLPTQFCACHMGDWVQKQIYARTAAGTASVAVCEGFEPIERK